MVGVGPQKLHVFISYARRDGTKFAASLFAALEAAGFDPFLDQHDIVPGEPWEDRLTRLLQEADTVVYVVTPGSAQSERCTWEVDEARKLGKRVIPVVAEEVPVAEMPPALQRLNFVFFTRDLSFGEALRQLSQALRTDLDWVREHTRLADAADRWRRLDNNEDLLWRSDELAIAKSWLAAWSPAKPEVTVLQRAFIQAAEEAEGRRNSAERQQLEEMVAAQTARVRATRIAFAIAAVLIAATGLGGALVYKMSVDVRNLEERAEQLEYENGVLKDSLEAQQDDLMERKREFAEIVEAADLSEEQPAQDGPGEIPADASDAIPPIEPDKGTSLPELSAGALDRIAEARWNVDVFWCAGPGGEANRARAMSIETALNDEKSLQAAGNTATSPLIIGRVRLRELSEAANTKRGYNIREDVMRPEPGEAREAAELVNILEQAGATVPAIGNSTTPTAQYLSVFICKSG